VQYKKPFRKKNDKFLVDLEYFLSDKAEAEAETKSKKKSILKKRLYFQTLLKLYTALSSDIVFFIL
jgi:hypothetical protein